MRIIFVRHGHPDYVHDCLTDLGHRHAAAAAQRLLKEGVEQIYSSTCGRALETAAHLADALHLPIHRCDFMREIGWSAADGQSLFEDGHPWSTADRMVAQGESLLSPAWAQEEPFRRNTVVQHTEFIARAMDEWLAALGYTREGLYYRVGENTRRTIAAFGHGGASAALMSHLFNLAFPFVCTAMGPDYTGITIVTLPDTPGALVSPRFELMNDARHIQGMTIQNVYDH